VNFHPENEWLGAEVDELLRLAGTGMSAELIGGKLGKSKNSVIGKLHRLGITKVKAKPTISSPPPKPKPPQVPKPPAPPPMPPPPPAPPPPAPMQMEEPAPEPEEPAPKPRTFRFRRFGAEALFALRDNECLWPIGTPGTEDFHFCAERRIDGKLPYCKQHARMAYGWSK
jgi:GcrA cell cycle regulator